MKSAMKRDLRAQQESQNATTGASYTVEVCIQQLDQSIHVIASASSCLLALALSSSAGGHGGQQPPPRRDGSCRTATTLSARASCRGMRGGTTRTDSRRCRTRPSRRKRRSGSSSSAARSCVRLAEPRPVTTRETRRGRTYGSTSRPSGIFSSGTSDGCFSIPNRLASCALRAESRARMCRSICLSASPYVPAHIVIRADGDGDLLLPIAHEVVDELRNLAEVGPLLGRLRG